MNNRWNVQNRPVLENESELNFPLLPPTSALLYREANSWFSFYPWVGDYGPQRPRAKEVGLYFICRRLLQDSMEWTLTRWFFCAGRNTRNFSCFNRYFVCDRPNSFYREWSRVVGQRQFLFSIELVRMVIFPTQYYVGVPWSFFAPFRNEGTLFPPTFGEVFRSLKNSPDHRYSISMCYSGGNKYFTPYEFFNFINL